MRNRIGRIIRGALGMALLWGATWGVAAGVLVALQRLLGVSTTRESLVAVLYVAAYGMIGGAVFAVLLVAARRRRIGELTLSRMAAWGGLAATIVPVGLTAGLMMRQPEFFSEMSPLPTLAQFAVLGATCGFGALWLARRSHAQPPSIDREHRGSIEATPPIMTHSVRASEHAEDTAERSVVALRGFVWMTAS
ncbi:MAG TPA: hypothetical protein VJR92_13265 [Gemmatimonadaceae bacterium]|nr:hypothetical protein [Gemmatimonadaceae bacterium]